MAFPSSQAIVSTSRHWSKKKYYFVYTCIQRSVNTFMAQKTMAAQVLLDGSVKKKQRSGGTGEQKKRISFSFFAHCLTREKGKHKLSQRRIVCKHYYFCPVLQFLLYMAKYLSQTLSIFLHGRKLVTYNNNGVETPLRNLHFFCFIFTPRLSSFI